MRSPNLGEGEGFATFGAESKFAQNKISYVGWGGGVVGPTFDIESKSSWNLKSSLCWGWVGGGEEGRETYQLHVMGNLEG